MFEIVRQMNGNFDYFTIAENGELLTDEFGNTLRFATYAEAEAYIQEVEA